MFHPLCNLFWHFIASMSVLVAFVNFSSETGWPLCKTISQLCNFIFSYFSCETVVQIMTRFIVPFNIWNSWQIKHTHFLLAQRKNNCVQSSLKVWHSKSTFLFFVSMGLFLLRQNGSGKEREQKKYGNQYGKNNRQLR